MFKSRQEKMRKRALEHVSKVDMKEIEAKLTKQLAELYNFVRWANTKILKTRKARKQFWRDICAGKPLLEQILKQMVEARGGVIGE